MIKVPATPAGLEALEELAAAGITLNVTLCLHRRANIAARDAVGAAHQQHWQARSVQERLQHLRFAASTFTPSSTCPTFAARPRARWASSARSGSGAKTGILDEQEACRSRRKSSLPAPAPRKPRICHEICGRFRRQRHRDQSAGHERRRREVRPDVHQPSTSCRRPRCSPKSIARSMSSAWRQR